MFEESRGGLDAPDLFRLLHHSENIGFVAETTVQRASKLATSLTSAVDRRDIGELKVLSKEAERALQEVGFRTVGAAAGGSATSDKSGAESASSMPDAIAESIPDESDVSVAEAVVSAFRPLLISLARVRGVIVRLEREWQILQRLRVAMTAMDQRRLSSSLDDARALKMSRKEHPDIEKAEALLANLERMTLLRARMRDLLERNDVGRDYGEYAAVLAETNFPQFQDSIVESLRRQYSALVLQLNFRKTFAMRRVEKLRRALSDLSKHMTSQDIPSIIKAARCVQGLFQDDRPEVRHARYAVAFLRNKERVLRDVARAEAMLRNSRATAYAMTVLEKALESATDFKMLGLPLIQEAVERLTALQRGRKGRDVLRATLRKNVIVANVNSSDLRDTASLIEAALADVVSSKFPVDETLKTNAAARLVGCREKKPIISPGEPRSPWGSQVFGKSGGRS